MYQYCDGLTKTPKILATTVDTYSCQYMFYDCDNLTALPELLATEMEMYCYRYMFYGCGKIKVATSQSASYPYAWRIPSSGTGSTASSWNTYMITGTTGTYTGTVNINTTYYQADAPE
jgi:hypothetical protein